MSEIMPQAAKSAIIVGSGVAGLSAASQLISHGIYVNLLERSPKAGGNSIKASSGINGAPTKYQPGLDDSFYEDTLKSAGTAIKTHSEQRRNLVSKLTNSSSSAISWLVDDSGIDLSRVAQLGAHSFPRTHRGAGQLPPGAAIVKGLLTSLESSPLFTLQTKCKVMKVLQTEGVVNGVEYVDENLGTAKAIRGPVIFASGGFAGDANGMLAQYRPDLTGFPSTNEPRPGSQKLLTDVGAQLLDMDLVQVHPTAFVDPKDELNPLKFLAGELLRGEGGILLRDGQRFVNEMESRQHVSGVITKQAEVNEEPKQWNIQLVLDEETYQATKSHVDFYLWKGLMKKTTVGALGAGALAGLQEYAETVSGFGADSLGRKGFGNWKLVDVKPESVVYTGRVTPAVHFTMGGVIINQKSEVLNSEGNPILGLWAAGEITGGLHGDNRLGGSSLLEGVVFGRVAADNAAVFLRE